MRSRELCSSGSLPFKGIEMLTFCSIIFTTSLTDPLFTSYPFYRSLTPGCLQTSPARRTTSATTFVVPVSSISAALFYASGSSIASIATSVAEAAIHLTHPCPSSYVAKCDTIGPRLMHQMPTRRFSVTFNLSCPSPATGLTALRSPQAMWCI